MNKIRKNTGRPFRFPFDIDRRYFFAFAALFFILSIKPINKHFWPRVSSETIINKINSSFLESKKEFEYVLKNINESDLSFSTLNQNKLNKLTQNKWSLSIYDNDSLIVWTKPNLVKHQPSEMLADTLYPFEINGTIGISTKKILKVGQRKFSILAEFPLYVHSEINNSNFKSYFTFLNQNNRQGDFGYSLQLIRNQKIQNANKPIDSKNNPIFKLVKKTDSIRITDKNFSRFFFIALPFIFFGISIHTYFKVSVTRNPKFYFIVLLLTAITFRLLSYYLNFPDNYNEFYLFNSSLYNSGHFPITLGDIFINACLGFWILFFFIMNVQHKVINFNSHYKKIIFIALYSLFLFATGYSVLLNFHSIITNSAIKFDTTNFNQIEAETIIGLGTLFLLFFNYVLCVIIFNRYFEKFYPKGKIKYLIPLIALLIGLLFADKNFMKPILIASLWTIVLIELLSNRLLNTKFDFSSYKLVYWIIFLSLSCVLLIHYFDAKKDVAQRQILAENILEFTSRNTKAKIIDLKIKLEKDNISPTTRANNNLLFDYINKKYISELSNNYASKFIIIDNDRTTLKNSINDVELFEKAEQLKSKSDSNKTFFIVDKFGEEEYILLKKIETKTIIFSVKPIVPFNITETSRNPTTEINLEQQNENSDYQLAFYLNNRLIKQTGLDYFPPILSKEIQNKSGPIKLKSQLNYSDIIAHSNFGRNTKSIIIRNKSNSFYQISTTYAYIFSIVFLILAIYILGNMIARSNLKFKRLLNLLGLTLRMRIHLAILLVELISLIVIGGFTILILSNNAKEIALGNSNVALNEISHVLENQKIENIDILSDTLVYGTNNFKRMVDPLLKKHNVGLNIFNHHGENIFSSATTNINRILPAYINPNALIDLIQKKKLTSVQTQKLGLLKYYTIYSPIIGPHDKVIGYLEIPNFSSQKMIEQNNSNIITMLINIYAFVFILSSMFAFYITKRLTVSFSKIVSQFSKINLTQTNTPLSWPYSDEIGLLIKEYNRTLRKLENSTALLAKSEREMAWREMAKQIAHDIKNPLTPMSLSLQSLQSAMKRNDPNVPQLTEKMTKTVLEQINVLTLTATNFSEFAKMIDVEARQESLIQILESTTGIYSDNEDVEFLFVLPKKDLTVFADKVKLIRVLTNVIQNAIQSIPPDRMGQIMLTVTKQANNTVLVSIEDNGDGIPEELSEKIFEPNFTTKSYGTGLGLAMCKDIMLRTGGNIYFESKEDVGSRFKIEIPIYHEQENF